MVSLNKLNIFDNFVNLIIFLLIGWTQVMGLAPFTANDNHRQSVRISKLLVIYCGFLAVLLLAVFVFCVHFLMNVILKEELNLPLYMGIIENVTDYVLMVVVYLVHFKKRHNFVQFFNESFEFYKKLVKVIAPERREIYGLIRVIGIKVALIDIPILVSQIFTEIAVRIKYPWLPQYYIVIFIAPSIFFTTVANIFISSIFRFRLFFTGINRFLQNSVDELNEINPKRRYELIKKSIELSDQLDRISILYSELYRLVKNLCHLTSFQILFLLEFKFVSAVAQLYFLYLWISNGSSINSSIEVFISGLMYSLTTFLSIYLIVYVSEELVTESQKTAFILHDFPSNTIDVRLRDSVSYFYLSIIKLNQN